MKIPRPLSRSLSSNPNSPEVERLDIKSPQTRRGSSILSIAAPKEKTQLQAKFFSLPLELRILIYQYFIQSFGWGDSIHIVTRSQLTRASPTPWTSTDGDLPDGDKLTFVPCAAQLGDPFQISGTHYGHWPRGHLACERVASWQTSWPTDGPPKPKDFVILAQSHVNLLLSCHRVHNEVSDYIYSTIRFDLLGLAAADRFLTLASQRQLKTMRKLYLSWQTTVPIHLEPLPDKISQLDRAILLGNNRDKLWTHICSILKEMKNLQDLRIAIYDVSWRPTPEEDLLEPLMDLHVERGTFIVDLRSAESEGVREEDIFTAEADAPFQIVRRAPGLDDGNAEIIMIDVGITNGRRRRPRRWRYLCVPFRCVYYTVETLIECIEERIRG